MAAKRIVYLTALAITLGISSTSNAELHIEGGPDGYIDCWITWMEGGAGGKTGLECHKITTESDIKAKDEKRDHLNHFTKCEVRNAGGRSLSRTYLICETV